MMKRKIFLCAVLVLVMCSCACARVQKFGHFTVDVPSGWTGELQGSTLVVKSNTVNASMAVAFNETGGASLADIAERLYIQMEGSDLQQDEDGDYVFTFTNLAGGESYAMITGDEDYYLVLSLTGYDNEDVQEELEAIMDSVDFEDD